MKQLELELEADSIQVTPGRAARRVNRIVTVAMEEIVDKLNKLEADLTALRTQIAAVQMEKNIPTRNLLQLEQSHGTTI